MRHAATAGRRGHRRQWWHRTRHRHRRSRPRSDGGPARPRRGGARRPRPRRSRPPEAVPSPLAVDVAEAEQVEQARGDRRAGARARSTSGSTWPSPRSSRRFWEIERRGVPAGHPGELPRATSTGRCAALRRMRSRDRGTIVQVGSALAYRGIPLQTAYCGSKHAIQGFHEALRCELLHEGSGVRVTMVQMPAVNTPQFSWVLSRLPRPGPAGAADLPAGGRRPRRSLYAADHPRRREYWVGGSTVGTLVGQRGRARAAGPLPRPHRVRLPADRPAAATRTSRPTCGSRPTAPTGTTSAPTGGSTTGRDHAQPAAVGLPAPRAGRHSARRCGGRRRGHSPGGTAVRRGWARRWSARPCVGAAGRPWRGTGSDAIDRLTPGAPTPTTQTTGAGQALVTDPEALEYRRHRRRLRERQEVVSDLASVSRGQPVSEVAATLRRAMAVRLRTRMPRPWVEAVARDAAAGHVYIVNEVAQHDAGVELRRRGKSKQMHLTSVPSGACTSLCAATATGAARRGGE